MLILDATNLRATPVAAVELPRRVPGGIHGSWIPDSRLWLHWWHRGGWPCLWYSVADTMTSRRQRFRDYMARVNGAADPADSIAQGFYIAPKDSVARRIAARLDLRPASSHLVVGGVGSGKTTQLLITRDILLAEHPDAVAVYVDLSLHQDLDELQPGSLLALAGLTLCDAAAPSVTVQGLQKSFQRWATGQFDAETIEVDDDDPAWGVVTPPRSPFTSEIKTYRDQLKRLLDVGFPGKSPVVLLVDSLDRMTDLEAFQHVAEQDVAALSSIGIGLVLIGPLRVLYGLEREVAERFDQFYRQPAVDVLQDHDGQRFLFEILRKRAPADILPDPSCKGIVEFSGGVLRDLLRLAHQAGDEAYVDGAERVEAVHVTRAADAFGRSLMLGLNQEELGKLQDIQATGKFVQTSQQDLALLVTRRVLDYQDASGELRYAVHPTLRPLLAARKKSSW